MNPTETLQDELVETYEDIGTFERRAEHFTENLASWWCESQRMQNKYIHKLNVTDEFILFLKVKYIRILNELKQTIN